MFPAAMAFSFGDLNVCTSELPTGTDDGIADVDDEGLSGICVELLEMEAVGVPDEDWVDVKLGVTETEGVLVAEGVNETDGVTDVVGDGVRLTLGNEVTDGTAELDDVGDVVSEGVIDSDSVGETLGEGEARHTTLLVIFFGGLLPLT